MKRLALALLLALPALAADKYIPEGTVSVLAIPTNMVSQQAPFRSAGIVVLVKSAAPDTVGFRVIVKCANGGEILTQAQVIPWLPGDNRYSVAYFPMDFSALVGVAVEELTPRVVHDFSAEELSN